VQHNLAGNFTEGRQLKAANSVIDNDEPWLKINKPNVYGSHFYPEITIIIRGSKFPIQRSVGGTNGF
jgi:hypothetical protein